jgi:transposase InsO family protein
VIAHVDALRAVQPRLGTRKLQDALATAGVPVGRDTLFTVLRTSGRLVPRKRRATQTTYSHHGYAVAPNLVTDLVVTGARHVVVCDITYLRLERDAFAYLFLVTDLFARYIVGWHLSGDLSHDGAVRALDQAQQALGDCTGIVHHSDRGSQYCCHAYLRQLHALRMLPSMTDAAHCYQNAVAERVNGILKDEFDLDAVFPTRAAAQHAVARAVTTYNTVRTHWSLDLQTPQAVFHPAAPPAQAAPTV